MPSPSAQGRDPPKMPPPATGWHRLAVAAILLVAAAGCATSAPAPAPQLGYAHLGPIRLDVAGIEIVDAYLPPLREPHVEHEFPVSPAEALLRWAQDRLVAAGGQRSARFVIRDAAVREVRLPTKKGLRGLFTTDQSERYDGRVAVTLEIRSRGSFRDAIVEAVAERSRTVPEDASVEERERVFLQITEDLVASLNGEIEKQIAAHLAAYRLP